MKHDINGETEREIKKTLLHRVETAGSKKASTEAYT